MGSIDTISATASGDAKKGDDIYKTIVVDATGNNGDLAKSIADTLGGEVGSLPKGETAPEGGRDCCLYKLTLVILREPTEGNPERL